MGQGSMTGRRMGRCANREENLKNDTAILNENANENANENMPENFQGRGFGFGRGRGRRGLGIGRQNRFRGGF